MTPRPFRLAVALLSVGLVAAACGGDDDDTASEPTPTTAAAPTTTARTATTGGAMGDEAEADIVDTAVAAGDFSTLVAAVEAAGLDETLRGEGPFTVFAPTDAAFAALPAGTVDTLLQEPSGMLTDILTYHVVEGAVLAEDVVGLDGQAVTTVNGASFTVEVGDGGTVTLSDAAGQAVEVTQTDIQTANGVIHVVDAVLMPQ